MININFVEKMWSASVYLAFFTYMDLTILSNTDTRLIQTYKSV